jgi:hypothetical protein
MEGDLNVSFPKTLTTSPPSPHKRHTVITEDGERVVVDDETHNVVDGHDDENVQDEEEEYEDLDISGVNVAWKFLLAGGIAGIGGLFFVPLSWLGGRGNPVLKVTPSQCRGRPLHPLIV